MQKVKVGVVGCGEVARRIYLPEFQRIQDKAELVAVCDLVEVRAKEAKERFGAKAYYADVNRFLRGSDVDIVVNLTPHKAHVPMSRAALQAGRHVYTEKVMAQSLEDATQLIELAQAQHVKFACAPVTLLLPSQQRWHALIQQGTIGRVTFARAQALCPPIWEEFPPEHVWYFAAGSGPLMEMGVYPLTALTGLFGPALRVSATARTIMPERLIGDGPAAGTRFPTAVEDSVHLHVDFGSFFASVDLSWCVQATRNELFEVYGEDGTLSGDPTSANTPIHLFRTGQAWCVEEPTQRLPRNDDWFQGVAHLVDCVLENAEPVNSATHARHVLDIMLTALRSAQEGRTLALQTTF
jgi:predicted dehydrogenase